MTLMGLAGAATLSFVLSGTAQARQDPPKKLITINPEALKNAVQAQPAGPPNKSIIIRFNQIRIQDEDDPISNDEPYLINIGFRAKVQLSGGKESIAPGTLTTHTIGTPVHNNLGRGGDNWADEVNNYNFDTQTFVASVPRTEAGWAVGVVSVLWEEDGFSDSTANLVRSKIKTAVHNAVQSLSMAGVDTNAITQAIIAKVTHDLGVAAKKFDLGGIITAIASAADPDDFGGVNVVLAFTLPNNAVMMFAGVPPDNVLSAPLTNVPANSPVAFDLGYPVGNLSQIPWRGRFEGKYRVRGNVTQSG